MADLSGTEATAITERTHSTMSYYCGVDIGGTFTDAVIMDDEGSITLGKVSSTPPDFARGFLNAVSSAAQKLGLTLEEFLPRRTCCCTARRSAPTCSSRCAARAPA